jgi:hypothetical protein
MYLSVAAPGEVTPSRRPRRAAYRSSIGDSRVTPRSRATSGFITSVNVTRFTRLCTITRLSSPSSTRVARSSNPRSAYCAEPEITAGTPSAPLCSSTIVTSSPSRSKRPSASAM